MCVPTRKSTSLLPNKAALVGLALLLLEGLILSYWR